MPWTNFFSPWFLLRIIGFLSVVVVVVILRGVLRQASIRRYARDVLSGKRVATELELDRCIQHIQAAPSYRDDQELLQQLLATRAELHQIQTQFSQRKEDE